MPTCRQCGKSFPNRMRIDGKIKNCCNRKFCVECSPFGKHNTSVVLDQDKQSVCTVCGKSYIFDRSKGHHRDKCNSCIINIRRDKLKKKAVEYKGGHCCVCGYSKCYSSLDFHHIDESEKDFGISQNYHKSWEEIRKELDKCVLVCKNCHGEQQEGMINLSERGAVGSAPQ